MSKNRDLFKEAIAEAKTIRDAALSNAKAVLEEQFTPHLKSMLSQKIQEMEEMEDMDEMDEVTEPVDEMAYEMEDEVRIPGLEEEMEDENMMSEMEEEINIDELLAEYDTEETVNEAKEENEDEEAEEAESETEEDEEDFNLEEMSEEDLKAFIEDVVKEMAESGEIESTEAEAEEAPEAEEDGEEMEITGLDEAYDTDKESMDEVSIDELLAEIDEAADTDKVEELESQLNEALKINKTLVNELNEINLLNSKLIHVNKIFRNKNLSETQKLQVLKAFDKAESLKEVKLVFESLTENLATKVAAKSSPVIKEHLGSASKSVTTANVSKPVVESNDMIARFQKLAGINKY